MPNILLSSKQKQALRQAKRLTYHPKTPQGQALLDEQLKKQPLLSGLEIRAARIGASRSIVPSRKRYIMWVKTQPKSKKAT